MYKALKGIGWPEERIHVWQELAPLAEQGEFSLVSSDILNLIDREPIKFSQYASDYATSWTDDKKPELKI